MTLNQCLHHVSGSDGVPHPKVFNFTFSLVNFAKVVCSSANELQQKSNSSSREEYIPPILTVLLEIHRVFVFCLSFVNNSQNNITTLSNNQRFWPGSGQNLTSPVWNFCRWVADVILRETSPAAKSEEKRLFSQVRNGWGRWVGRTVPSAEIYCCK